MSLPYALDLDFVTLQIALDLDLISSLLVT